MTNNYSKILRNNILFFRKNLLHWLLENKRDLPWKFEKDIYKIWVSEIILQQTRAQQAVPYYLNFIEIFPNVNVLAKAPIEHVLKAWEGLGYYNRARNLHETAKFLVENLDGNFPIEYENILKLKGVGSYTAAAIASFGYNAPYAVCDGNVFRVMARFTGKADDISLPKVKNEFAQLAQQFLDFENPALYNQAIMDFGALICTPQNALCNTCVLSEKCYAFKHNLVDVLPVNNKKINIKKRHFNYLVFYSKTQPIFFIEKRDNQDIWQGLYQFPLIEKMKITKKDIASLLNINEKDFSVKEKKLKSQKLTHQAINATFWLLNYDKIESLHISGFTKILGKDIKKYYFPKIIRSFLENTK